MRNVTVTTQPSLAIGHAVSAPTRSQRSRRTVPDDTDLHPVGTETPLGQELSTLLAGLARHHRVAMARRLGWDGRGGCTLSQAADLAGVTRERVRQVIASSRQRLNAPGPLTLPAYDKVLETITSLAPAGAARIERHLERAGSIPKEFRVDGLLRSAPVIGRDMALAIERVQGTRFILPRTQGKLPSQILSVARRLNRHAGFGSITGVAERLSKLVGYSVPEHLAAAVLSTQPDFVWLDESSGWFLLTAVSQSRVTNQIQKVMSCVTTIEIGDLREGVARPLEMRRLFILEDGLLAICTKRPECVVEGRLVRRARVLAEDQALSPAEKTCARVLREFGGTATCQPLRQACLASGLGSSVVWRIMFYASWLKKYPSGTYGFRGVRTHGPEDVKRFGEQR